MEEASPDQVEEKAQSEVAVQESSPVEKEDEPTLVAVPAKPASEPVSPSPKKEVKSQ